MQGISSARWVAFPAGPLAAALAVLLLAAVPFPVGATPAAPGIPPHLAGERGGPTSPALPSHANVASSGRLPGTSTSGAPFVDVGALISAQLKHWNPWGAPTVSTASPLPRPSTVPTALTTGGTISGTVIDSTFGTPVANVSVIVSSVSGLGCRTIPCLTTTDSHGGFSVTAPVGADEVDFSHPYYVDNRTWTTVSNSSLVRLGSIYLVHDGYADGVLRGDRPGTPALPGVQLTATSRDGLVQASPGSVTAANGSFRLPVPPFPSRIDFAPAGASVGYQLNWSYVNATPYSVVHVGTVYLEGGIRVAAHLYDAVTGAPIPANIPSTLDFCSEIVARACTNFGNLSSGPNVSAYGIVGPAAIRALALGYVVNDSPVPDVRPLAAGLTDDVGRVNLMPLGLVRLSTNFSGQSARPTAWPPGNLTVFPCTLDGLSIAGPVAGPPWLAPTSCWPPTYYPGPLNTYPLGGTALIAAPPLHVILFLEPRNFTFPVATVPIPDSLPSWPQVAANLTWVNVTPDRVTAVGSFDLTAGNYLAGNVSLTGLGVDISPQAVQVQSCSTDEASVCGGAALLGTATTLAGCPTTTLSFCVDSPPGPVLLTVTAFGAVANHTWTSVPRGCCGQDGHPTPIGLVNLSGTLPAGQLSGTILAAPPAGGGAAAPISNALVSVEACLVGPAPTGWVGPVCESTGANLTDGGFNLTVLSGWNRVTAFAAGFRSNWTWVDVTGVNTSGEIYLTPLAAVAGRVLLRDGSGAYEADVLACPLATLNLCRTVGAGLTSTDGRYNGTIPGSPFPGGVYQIMASASGYVTNWIWVNASAGALSLVPPIVLSPIGVNGTGPVPRNLLGLAGSAGGGSWVDGRLVDSRSGVGVPGAQITACPVAGGVCLPSPDSTSFGGEFNTSFPPGVYRVFLNATQYGNASVVVDVGIASVVHAGTVSAVSYPWVSGRLLLGPWGSLTTGLGLGPGDALISGCNTTLNRCGAVALVSTGGFFNVTAPPGPQDSALVVGAGVNGGGFNAYGTASTGFTRLTLSINASSAFVQLPLNGSAPLLEVFGALSGSLRDATSFNATGVPRDPASFGQVYATTNGGQQSAALAQTGGGGNFTIFQPSDGSSTFLLGVGTAFLRANRTYAAAVAPGINAPFQNISMPHYGWVVAQVQDAMSGAPLAYAVARVSVLDPVNATTLLTVGISNGDGLLNATAPPSGSATVTFGLDGYANRTFVIPVVPSQAVMLGVVNLTFLGSGAGAWVQSVQVNTVGASPVATVVDNLTGAPLAGARVTMTVGGSAVVPPSSTNDLGQFLLYTPPNPVSTLVVQLPAYSLSAVSYNLTPRERLVVPAVNLTGDGVIGGQVLVEPGGTPAANVGISACPPTGPGCLDQTQTNLDGWFWIDAPQGTTIVSVLTDLYLANQTAIVNVRTDSWVGLAPIDVFAFATLNGTVRGLPTGTILSNANVSLCSPFGTPFGGCFESVPTDANGSFKLVTPAGTFVLYAVAAGYNGTFFSVAVTPGEHLALGTVYLDADGLVNGSVVSATTGAVLPGASVTGCGAYAGGVCSGPAFTDGLGRFQLVTTPGPVQLTVVANGYLDRFEIIRVPTGDLVSIPPIALFPVAAQIPVSLSGRVVEAANPGTGIAGAFVALFSGGAAVISTATDHSGAFALVVDEGSYTLTASRTGFHPYSAGLSVAGPIANLTLALGLMVYPVSGTVSDARSGAPVRGISISEFGAVLNTTGSSGRYLLELANGTHLLNASGGSASPYPSLTFDVKVNGAPLSHDLQLTENGVRLTVEVVSGGTGLPIQGATVVVLSTPSNARLRAGTTGLSGNYSVLLSAGTVQVEVTAPGFDASSTPLNLTGSAVFLPVTLAPVTTAASGIGAIPPVVWPLLGAAAVAVVAALVWSLRRAPPAKEGELSRWGVSQDPRATDPYELQTSVPEPTEADEPT